jgi:hypothetical protein
VIAMLVGGSIVEDSGAPTIHERWSSAHVSAQPSRGNPRQLRVALWLGDARDGVSRSSHVRFEWDAVPGARGYLLRGRWTGSDSWAMRSTEHRVSATTATCWSANRVEFETTLPPGSHSWRVVALFGPDESGDFENPTRLSFDVR